MSMSKILLFIYKASLYQPQQLNNNEHFPASPTNSFPFFSDSVFALNKTHSTMGGLAFIKSLGPHKGVAKSQHHIIG